MLVHRGAASDYEKWVQAGAEGWGPEEVLKYFKKSEVGGSHMPVLLLLLLLLLA